MWYCITGSLNAVYNVHVNCLEYIPPFVLICAHLCTMFELQHLFLPQLDPTCRVLVHLFIRLTDLCYPCQALLGMLAIIAIDDHWIPYKITKKRSTNQYLPAREEPGYRAMIRPHLYWPWWSVVVWSSSPPSRATVMTTPSRGGGPTCPDRMTPWLPSNRGTRSGHSAWTQLCKYRWRKLKTCT